VKNTILLPQLIEMLSKGNREGLKDFCETRHPAEIAELLSSLTPEDAWAVLKNTGYPLRSEIFSRLYENLQVEIIGTLKRNDIVKLITDMPPDERADLFKLLPEDKQRAVLPALAQAEREDIRRLTSYEEGTAGAVMTSDYATLPPSVTAAEAIEYLRTAAPDKETIYYSYVLDSNRKLIGYVSLKDLIIADRNEIVSNIMERELIFARVDEDQEEAARKIQKYELIALPVVNKDGVLVGIITHDDAMDILMQENTEDMEKFMAITGTHEAAMYLKTSVWDHFKNRAGWVVILAALGLISGAIVEGFSELLIQFSILATFMPMLADTGGNTGSQSATLVVRALALNEIKPQDVFRVLLKEVKVASLLALLLAVLAVGRVVLLESGAVVPMGYSIWRIAIAIAIAFGLQVVTATLIGALLPLAAAKLKFDPAVVASPALTTLVDITGLLIYFSTAKLMLGI